MYVVGPAASDGPLFVVVSVTVPDWPGVIVGEEVVSTTSALRGPAVSVVGDTELFVALGSAVAPETEVDPPLTVPGAAEAARSTGSVTVVLALEAIGPAIVQVIGPDAVPLHPDGSEPTTTVSPAGGV